MLPDLDSESGRPIRELFPLLAAGTPLLLMPLLLAWGGNMEGATALAVGAYFAIRYGGAFLLRKLSVHRGMFHSIPALVIAAEIAFLAYRSPDLKVRCLMAGGTALGFLSHLVLDEIYAVEWSGVRVKFNKFAGSALKMTGGSVSANAFTYAVLVTLTYAVLVNAGYVTFDAKTPPVDRHATETVPQVH
jgi:membrane-bound metal-dependent hydrolase YbcI (DUF457 family)